jgi:hypothetical protein
MTTDGRTDSQSRCCEREDHGGKAGLELGAVQKAVAISIEASKHQRDRRGQLPQTSMASAHDNLERPDWNSTYDGQLTETNAVAMEAERAKT